MTEPRRAALYVDFDNVFSALAAFDEWAAWSFATSPGRWLDWFARELPDGPRRLLVRRCYLNPAGWTEPERGGSLAAWLGQPRIYYSRFRAEFVRAGFQVVDCPRLARLKNAADIVMALDIVDALAHPTRFEDFIIVSSDSDFTPLLHRLREHDRRVLAVTQDASAEAYRAAADLVIPLGDFAEAALLAEAGTPAPDPLAVPGPAAALATLPAPPATAIADAGQLSEPDRVPDPGTPEAQRAAILGVLRRLLAVAPGPLHLPALGKRVHFECGAWVRRCRFGGAGTLAKLIESSGDLMLEAGPGGGWVYDPRRHERPSLSQPDLPENRRSHALAPLRAALGETQDLPRLGAEEMEFVLGRLAGMLPLPGPPGTEARAALVAEAVGAGFDVPAQALDALVQWLQRARFDWQPAADPTDTAARLGRIFYAAITHQAAAAGARLPAETLAALRDWIGLTPQRGGEQAAGVEDGATVEPDRAPA